MTAEKLAAANPGGREARENGCTCPILDNNCGGGIPTKDGPKFWIAGDCPLHAPRILARAAEIDGGSHE